MPGVSKARASLVQLLQSKLVVFYQNEAEVGTWLCEAWEETWVSNWFLYRFSTNLLFQLYSWPLPTEVLGPSHSWIFLEPCDLVNWLACLPSLQALRFQLLYLLGGATTCSLTSKLFWRLLFAIVSRMVLFVLEGFSNFYPLLLI